MAFKPNIKAEKEKLRSAFKAERKSIPKKEREDMDRRLLRNLRTLAEVRHCTTVLTYVSTPDELDTKALINGMLDKGRKVAVPRCIPDSRNMSFHYINSLDELVEARYSLLEPTEDMPLFASGVKGAVCIVPALSCDLNGYRIGYGGGYYDRFLSSFGGTKIGITYNRFIRDVLPRGRYDIKLDYIVTESAIIRIQHQRSTKNVRAVPKRSEQQSGSPKK